MCCICEIVNWANIITHLELPHDRRQAFIRANVYCQLNPIIFEYKFMTFYIQNAFQSSVRQMVTILSRDQYVNVGPWTGVTVYWVVNQSSNTEANHSAFTLWRKTAKRDRSCDWSEEWQLHFKQHSKCLHKNKWWKLSVSDKRSPWPFEGKHPKVANFVGPTWGPSGSCRPQMDLMWVPWTLLLGPVNCWIGEVSATSLLKYSTIQLIIIE